VSFFIKIGRARQEPEKSAWMQRMQEQAQVRAAMAAERMGPSAQRARDMAGDRMVGARMWTAPQLDRVAGYVENELGPRISAMLSSTARRIEPTRPSHRLRNTVLIILGTCGAIGLAGAMYTRYKMMSDTYEELTEETASAAHSAAHSAAMPQSASERMTHDESERMPTTMSDRMPHSPSEVPNMASDAARHSGRRSSS
jgi:hypothetical protein